MNQQQQNDRRPLDWQMKLLRAFLPLLIISVVCSCVSAFAPRYLFVDDYQSQYLPAYHELGSTGMRPLHLSSHSWFGGAIAGELQYGVYSPLHRLIIFLVQRADLSPQWSATAILIFYLWLTWSGCLFLAQCRGVPVIGGLLVASVACFNEVSVHWLAPDWIAALVSFAWLPWAWAFFEKLFERKHAPLNQVGAALAMFGLITSGFAYCYLQTAVVLASLYCGFVISERRFIPPAAVLTSLLAGTICASPALVSFFEYWPGTGRSSGGEYFTPMGLIPTAFPGLLNPFYRDWWLTWNGWRWKWSAECSVGVIPCLLAIDVLWQNRKALPRRTLQDVLVLILGFTLTCCHQIGPFRWFLRLIPLPLMALTLIGASGLKLKSSSLTRTVLPVSMALLVCFTLFSRFRGPVPAIDILLTAVVVSTVLLWALMYHRSIAGGSLHKHEYASFLATVLLLLLPIGALGPNQQVPKWHITRAAKNAFPLSRNRLYLSVYTWRDVQSVRAQHDRRLIQYLRPMQTSMYASLRFINGYSPLEPFGYRQLLCFGFQSQAINRQCAVRLLNQQSDSGVLHSLGVNGLVISREFRRHVDPLVQSGWRVRARRHGVTILHHDSLTRQSPFFFASGSAEGSSTSGKASQITRDAGIDYFESSRGRDGFTGYAQPVVTVVDHLKDRVSLQVRSVGNTPALLVLRRPFFPGYKATLDGKKSHVIRANLIQPAVLLPPYFSGVVEIRYLPLAEQLAVGAYILGLLMLGAAMFISYRGQSVLAVMHRVTYSRRLSSLNGCASSSVILQDQRRGE